MTQLVRGPVAPVSRAAFAVGDTSVVAINVVHDQRRTGPCVQDAIGRRMTTNPGRRRGLTVAATLMILFGLAEVATGFTHNFFGVRTSEVGVSTEAGVALGTLYVAGGWLILTRRKWAIALAIGLLGVNVLGRITMASTGLYPVDTVVQTVAILVGTAIAAFFTVYVGLKLLE